MTKAVEFGMSVAAKDCNLRLCLASRETNAAELKKLVVRPRFQIGCCVCKFPGILCKCK
jgi:hypothetical protein